MEAKLNITINGQNGDLPDMVDFDSNNADIFQWATEAVRTGGVPGIDADPNVDFTDFVVDRFNANEARPFNLIQIRPKVPFGMPHDQDGKELKVGDLVTVACLVTNVYSTEEDQFCNVNLETVHPMPPYGKGTTLTLNTKQVRLSQRNKT